MSRDLMTVPVASSSHAGFMLARSACGRGVAALAVASVHRCVCDIHDV